MTRPIEPVLLRRVLCKCELCKTKFIAEITTHNRSPRKTCSPECATVLATRNTRSRGPGPEIEQSELWRRAAIIRHNKMVDYSGKGTKREMDW
jgi:hypothetical protein